MTGFQLTGTILLAAGVITTAVGVVMLSRDMRRIDSWAVADARVVNSVAVDASNLGPPLAKYELWYEANGKMLSEQFISQADTFEEARRRVLRHPAGSVVQIRYNPANPRELDPNLGYNASSLSVDAVVTGFGFALVPLSAIFLLLGRRKRVTW